MEINNYLLNLRNITKRFPGVLALDGASFDLKIGEIHALVGENGAGKSTLIKVLTGYYKKDSGDIMLNGRKVEINNPRTAIELGIGAIYQESSLIPDISIAENIFLGRLSEKGLSIIYNKSVIIEKSRRILEKLKTNIDPAAKISSLNATQCRVVEICKAISRDVRILILDEPTAALPKKEVEIFFNLINSLKKDGISIIYISHLLDEIFTVTDVVSILRNGKNVGTFEARRENREKIIKCMVGREIKKLYPKININIGEKILEINNINKKNIYESISFSLHRGEIISLYGLIGSGHKYILQSIIGLCKPDSGKIVFKGKVANISSPLIAKKYNIGLIPEDRKKDGLILEHDILKNISLGNLDHFEKGGVIQKRKEYKTVMKWINELQIASTNTKQKVKNLSGGNQQKVVLARLLESKADILLMDGPTVGVDVGAKVEIYKILENLCSNGKGIIIVSEDLEEVISMTDKIILIKNGRKVGEFKSKEITKEEVLQKIL